MKGYIDELSVREPRESRDYRRLRKRPAGIELSTDEQVVSALLAEPQLLKFPSEFAFKSTLQTLSDGLLAGDVVARFGKAFPVAVGLVRQARRLIDPNY